MAISFWSALNTLAPIIAPIVSIVIVFMGKVMWNQEQRIRGLEQSMVRHSRTLYGDDADMQQPGLSENLQDVIDRLERLEQKIDSMHDTNERRFGPDQGPSDDD